MKKILLVFVCSLFAFETVLAQEKNAVGLRLGDGVEFLYQRDLSSRNFLQFTLATPHFEGLSVTGIYNQYSTKGRRLHRFLFKNIC